MQFSSSNNFDFKPLFLSSFMHTHNKEDQTDKIRQARCVVVPVEVNLDSKISALSFKI